QIGLTVEVEIGGGEDGYGYARAEWNRTEKRAVAPVQQHDSSIGRASGQVRHAIQVEVAYCQVQQRATSRRSNGRRLERAVAVAEEHGNDARTQSGAVQVSI